VVFFVAVGPVVVVAVIVVVVAGFGGGGGGGGGGGSGGKCKSKVEGNSKAIPAQAWKSLMVPGGRGSQIS
jgi:hypothetical protein